MLTSPCETLPGVGPTLAAKLAKCGIHTVQDLLFHLPFRYQDRTRITPIQDLRKDHWCVISGRVCKTEVKHGKRMMLYCYVEDKTGVLKLRFFHFNKQQIKNLNESHTLRAFGEVREFANQLEMIHPEYQLLNEGEQCRVEENLTPIYPSTQGLTQTRLRQLVKMALNACHEHLEPLEWMDEALLNKRFMMPIGQAIQCLHTPPPDTSIYALETGKHPALKRLIFDELLAQRLSMQFARQHRLNLVAPALLTNQEYMNQFLNLLPFSLTQAQRSVYDEIQQDMTLTKPMLRLVQGDVGAGKTVVAALAALQAIANGFQVAFMAPTDILSDQHSQNLTRWFTQLGLSVKRLSGKMKARERKEALQALASHDCHLIIGTHALFQAEVNFAKLGLIIIDEQHRFGVEQRLALHQKGQHEHFCPHQLLMTATPIPRTLAMTQFAHIDLSVLDELPPGRTPVVTAVLNQNKRQQVIERLKSAIAGGRQAYWVCTLIEDSEKLQCMAATNTAETLQTLLPEATIGLVHGRMKPTEKDAIMGAFKRGEIELLVATTVIEVGVDVPNASLMIIENAERLGLSQLHQLRGRVGRGNNQSHCLLLYQAPLSQIGQQRLKLMRETTDGFLIAEKDLELRGSGEVLGTRQTGYRQFKVAEFPRDKDILSTLAPIAKHLVEQNPETATQITKRWLGSVEGFLRS
ncbi:ATP-dependent DNA helicase RecG [Legionella yabuuchiae]|uniref:ATP-dependent DNA helicase RecG n=1 Tax=Legionella yabuuchiae TaxID=376727 RepID=UPI001055C483|nr:ATP-dependent DNA helicase RecG [Legionella yabuuchiae]